MDYHVTFFSRISNDLAMDCWEGLLMHFNKLISGLQVIRVDLLILVGCIGIFIPIAILGQPTCVGDGSQYYALSLAWKSTYKPFMTDVSWTEYGHLVESGRISGLVDVDRLKNAFPSLTLGSSADFAHFWFYSLCAAIISKTVALLGINIFIQTAFLILHCLLLSCMLIIARRCFGWKGLTAAAIITFLSPMIWYFDKVHTELFTYCVTISAIILFLRRRYLGAAFFLALASTQNISFIAISLFVIGLYIFSRGKEKYSIGETALFALTIGVMALHPAYYFFRYGVLDPPFVIGSAKIGESLRTSYIWFLDPDVGLFPNWPFGIALLIFSIFALRSKKLVRSSVFLWLAFVSWYIAVSLLAQDSTTNLNSGGSPGLARYAIWYLGLFFPAALVVVERVVSPRWIIATAALGIFGVAFGIAFFRPSLPENYTSPSFVSFWVEKYLPSIYYPPPEIFAERYSGIGEDSKLWNALAVIGPDCHKVLLTNQSLNSGKVILGGKSCGFDMDKLSLAIGHRLSTGSWRSNDGTPVYVNLSEAEFEESRFVPILDNWYMANTGSVITGLMSSGWSVPESWGTWSDNKKATLTLPCFALENQLKVPRAIELELSPFIALAHPHISVSIYFGTGKVWSGILDKPTIIKISMPQEVCDPNKDSTLNFMVDNPVSPASLGLSSDSRLLGIGLLRIRFTAFGPVN